MNLGIVILVVLIFNVEAVIKASMSIVNYDPLSFRLTFSENLTLPVFQILVDSNNLPYRVINNQTSAVYDIEVTQNYQQYDPNNTEEFSLVFNYPLDVGNGQLYISNYILSPTKLEILATMSTWPVYFVFSLLFICSLYGVIGLFVIDFIQIYVLTAMKFNNKTSVIESYSEVFLFNRSELQSDPKFYIFTLIKPTIILIAIFLLGIGVKFGSRLIKNQFLGKRMVKFISYNTFLAIWTIALPSIIYKGFEFINDVSNNRLELTNNQYTCGIIFTYLNFLNFITYFYVLYFILNPKVNEGPEKFRAYMLSSEFELYNKFHRGLHLRDWFKRNTFLFFSVRKLIILVLFFIFSNILPYVLGLQLITSFFIFTVRPYKEWFYTNSMIIFNLLWFFSYIVSLEGFFYFDISNTLETRSALLNYLCARAIIFHIVCFLGVIGAVFEGVRLFKNLRYEFTEESNVKEKHNPIAMNRGRLLTETVDKFANEMIVKESIIIDSPESSIEKKKKREPSNSSIAKGKINLFEVEMSEYSPSITDRKFSSRIKKKWKDRSLLEQLATN